MPKPLCHGKTKKDKPCRNFALPNELFCRIHIKIPPPPGVWDRVRAGLATAADIGKVVSASDVIYHAIAFVVKHYPLHLFTSGVDSEYQRLVQFVGRDSADTELDPGPIDWSKTYSIYIAARQIAEKERPITEQDSHVFDDFNEWFIDLSDAVQIVLGEPEEDGYEELMMN